MAEVENVIRISVEKKIATLADINFELVGGNSDYKVVFDFDDEWSGYDVKTALFVFGNKSVHKPFSGNVCDGVAIENATICLVGVYSGNLATTTPASLLGINLSIRDVANGFPEAPEEDVYDQIIALINEQISTPKNGVPKMHIIDQKRIETYEQDGGYYFSENNWKSFIGDKESNKFGYNRVYVERSQERGTYGMYALSYNAEPIYNAWYSKSEWEKRFAKEHPNETFREPYDHEYPLIDSVVQRQNNGQIVVPTRPLEGWHATSKAYTDDLISKLIEEITSIKEDVYSGTEGLAYKISDGGDHYICTGLGTVPQNSDIEIAGYYGGLPVTEIGTVAFNNRVIKSIRIPNTIKVFGYNAFGWSGPVGAVYVKDLAKWAAASFESSGTPVTANPTPPKVYIKGRYTTDLVIPEGVTYISRRAFMHWKQFETLTLPSTVKVLDEMAFQYCQGLESVTIPASVERVEASSFGLCYALKSVTFEGKPKMISPATFQNDTAIFDIYVPWKEGEVAGAPWGATNATVHYGYKSIHGLTYALSDDGSYYTCTGLGTTTERNFAVESEINGIPVTAIGTGFSEKQLNSLDLPATITKMPGGSLYEAAKTIIIHTPEFISFDLDGFGEAGEKMEPYYPFNKKKSNYNPDIGMGGGYYYEVDTYTESIYVAWSEEQVFGQPWGALMATIHYNH